MAGHRGRAVSLLLPAIALIVFVVPSAAGRYLRFEPGFEYQYKYRSRAQVHRVDKFTMEARVSQPREYFRPR